jgi:predicted ATP-grasp superfamily ATP-dependent carboligase
MKKTKAEVLAKKIAAIERVLNQMYGEIMNLKDLSIGTHELVKQMPGYDEAIEKLKQEAEKQTKEKNELE